MNNIFLFLLFNDPVKYVCYVILMTFSICLHEYCHSLVAHYEGDDTGKMLGFMTMNPLRVMGTSSIITLLIFGIAWGQVPIATRNMKHSFGGVLTAAAGPLSNLLLAFLTALCLTLLPLPKCLVLCLMTALHVNVLLAVFNLLPIPSLDGWHICTFLFPVLKRLTQEQCSIILFVAIALLWFTPLNDYLNAAVVFIEMLLLFPFGHILNL